MWSISWIIPKICRLCEQYHKDQLAICKQCIALLASISNACVNCGINLPAGNYNICGHCIKKKPLFDFALAPYFFVEPLRSLIHEFKYQDGLYLTSFLAFLILKNIPTTMLQTQCLIPIPLHKKRLQERGYNQAAELVKILARKLKKPYHLFHCQKIINTIPQVNLDAGKRHKNLYNAFKIRKNLPFSHVTIVDDLLTTGSTANEMAKILKAQGVIRVDVWCCARS